MNIIINGENRGIPAGASLMELLKFLDINHERVAIEYNMDILDKKDFNSICLKENDSVEIIAFVGGGYE